jgi:hypothetical protein
MEVDRSGHCATGADLPQQCPRFRKVAAICAVPFLLMIVALVLDLAGVLSLDRRIILKPLLILSLFGWWLVVSLIVWLILSRRRAAAFLSKHRKGLIVSTVTLFVSLVAAEVGLRIRFPSSGLSTISPFGRTDPQFHHIYPPHGRFYGGFFEGSGAVAYETNEDGLRTPYAREEFLKHNIRVAVLGDSYTFGMGVHGEDTFCSVMERTLRNQLGSDQVAVLNAGVVSSSPLLEGVLFRRVVRHYKPQLTLLFVDGTDIGDDYKYGKEVRTTDDGEIVFDVPNERVQLGLLNRTALGKLLEPLGKLIVLPFETIGRMTGSGPDGYSYYSFTLELDEKVEKDRWFILRHPLETSRPFFEQTLKNIEQVAADVRASGSEFGLVVIPRYFHWDPSLCPQNWEHQYYTGHEPYRFAYLDFFQEASRRVDFKVFSLLPAFEAWQGEGVVFRRDPHWNSVGHQLVGEGAAYLVESGMLQSQGR